MSGINVVERVNTKRYPTEHNDRYLLAKEKRGGNPL
jgi:GTP cyclohydrolase II